MFGEGESMQCLAGLTSQHIISISWTDLLRFERNRACLTSIQSARDIATAQNGQ